MWLCEGILLQSIQANQKHFPHSWNQSVILKKRNDSFLKTFPEKLMVLLITLPLSIILKSLLLIRNLYGKSFSRKFVPNCSGGSNLNFWRKNRQIHLIIIREGPKNLPPHHCKKS